MLRLTTPLTRRCLSLEHVCKHTAVNKCANTGRASAERAGWLPAFCFGHEAAAVVCCFSSLLRSLSKAQIPNSSGGEGKKKKTPHTQLFMLTQHFIGRICQDQFIRHPVNFFTLIWPPNFLPSAHNFSASPFPFLELLTSNWELRVGEWGGRRSSKIVQIWLIWRYPSARETHGLWRFGHLHFWLILSGSPPCSWRPLCERYVSLRLQRLHFVCVFPAVPFQRGRLHVAVFARLVLPAKRGTNGWLRW